MVVYYIANFTITDQAKFDEYSASIVKTIGSIFADGKGKMLVSTAGDDRSVKEGVPLNNLLVVEFESRETAEGWYNSEAVQALVPKRLAATDNNSWVTITDKFTPPS